LRRFVTAVVLGAGLALGLWHHWLAVRAIFVFRGAEPLASWMAVLAGPASTLPAAIVALFRRTFGGWWLIGGGLVSTAALVVSDAGIASWFITRITLPMCGLGVGLLLLDRRGPRGEP
jgi:hypothetical protein